MTNIDEALRFARSDNCLLFCGAGFSSGCINDGGGKLPSASGLKDILNEKLDHKYEKLGASAKAYKNEISSYELFELLKKTYKVNRVSQDVIDILKFNWMSIYTTNFDNAIDIAMIQNRIKRQVINNTDKKGSIKKHGGIPIIHLHGCVEKWDFENNFELSCVLDTESYLKIPNQCLWLIKKLRSDYDRAKYIFFVGFSNSDFYLHSSLYGADKKKDNVFFINSLDDVGNKDLEIDQTSLGNPLAIGTSEFARKINETLRNVQPTENFSQLENFQKFQLPELPNEPAGDKEQYDLVYKGKENIAFHYKDIFSGTISYRIPRNETREVLDHMEEDKAVCLVTGDISCGKSIFLKEIMLHLVKDGKDVFYLKNRFDNIHKEIEKIFRLSPSPIFVIDDCFISSSDWLEDLIKKIDDTNAKIILATRSLARDTEKNIKGMIKTERPFDEFILRVLDDSDIENLIQYIDRIGGWGEEYPNKSSREKLIKNAGKHLAWILIRIFSSGFIINKFQESLERINASDSNLTQLIILALYLRNCGVRMNSEYFLSEALGFDVSNFLSYSSIRSNSSISEINEWVSIAKETNEIEVMPAVNARESLKQIFKYKKVIVDVIIDAIKNIEHVRYEGEFYGMFRQLMRYTNLKQIVTDAGMQDKFFDRLSEFSFCRKEILFWLQYSIAMRETGKLERAEKYLKEAYGKAGQKKSYSTWQLDDQQAALYLDKGIALTDIDAKNQGRKLTYFREAFELQNMLISRPVNGQTPHPYLKIEELFPKYFKNSHEIPLEHKKIYLAFLKRIKLTSEKNYQQVKRHEDSYLGKCINLAIEEIEKCIAKIEAIEG